MTTIFLSWIASQITIKLKSDDPQIFGELIDSLKRFIPACHRRYAPQERTWFVAGAAFGDLEEWIEFASTAFGVQVIWQPGGSGQSTRQSPPAPLVDAYAALHLQPTAPPELIKAAYRTLAQLHHPDHQGDTAAMRRIWTLRTIHVHVAQTDELTQLTACSAF